MPKPPRLARPFFANTASKLPSSRREDLNSKQKKASLGEKILRTGGEGNLVKQQQVHSAATPAQRKASAQPDEETETENFSHFPKIMKTKNGSPEF